MSKQDLGLGQKHTKNEQRSINKDGSFNVRKIGAVAGVRDLYQYLVSISWGRFLFLVILTYFTLNIVFALIYYFIGIDYLNGLESGSVSEEILGCFYFSTQTFTTVGYGAVAPAGTLTNLMASMEAMIGLLSFAMATGLLFGRFSKPNAKFLFSDKIILSPYKKNLAGLMFRVVNKRNNILLETSAEVMLIYFYQDEKGEEKRGFNRLELEISDIKLFPTSWTVVHPITDKSPFYEFTKEQFLNYRFEILVMIKSFDETFGQNVYARTSFRPADFVYSAKFHKPYKIGEDGIIEVDLNDVMKYTEVESLEV